MFSNYVTNILSKNPSRIRERDSIEIIYGNSMFIYTETEFQKIYSLLQNSRYKWREISQNKWILKDYGPQISWRLVYIIEYFGALIAMPLFMMFVNVNLVTRIDVILWIIHYTKRLYESIYVHSFSAETMPFTNVFKNSFYYWGAGAVIGYYGSHVTNTNFIIYDTYNSLIICLWGLCQITNGYCHYYLANLRNKKESEENKIQKNKHIIPTNFLFRYACCPNYGFEILGWFLFAILGLGNLDISQCFNQMLTTENTLYFTVKIIFCMIGSFQMYFWAKGKKRRYKLLYEDKYKVSKLLIPGVI